MKIGIFKNPHAEYMPALKEGGEFETLEQTAERELSARFHYHGFVVRRLFIFAAIVMLATLPFNHSYIPYPLSFSVAAILILAIGAGMATPRKTITAVTNALISVFATTLFIYYATYGHIVYPDNDFFLVINLALATTFLFASYNAIKTLRGIFLDDGTT